MSRSIESLQVALVQPITQCVNMHDRPPRSSCQPKLQAPVRILVQIASISSHAWRKH